jgi:hypothetical protein
MVLLGTTCTEAQVVHHRAQRAVPKWSPFTGRLSPAARHLTGRSVWFNPSVAHQYCRSTMRPRYGGRSFNRIHRGSAPALSPKPRRRTARNPRGRCTTTCAVVILSKRRKRRPTMNVDTSSSWRAHSTRGDAGRSPRPPSTPAVDFQFDPITEGLARVCGTIGLWNTAASDEQESR